MGYTPFRRLRFVAAVSSPAILSREHFIASHFIMGTLRRLLFHRGGTPNHMCMQGEIMLTIAFHSSVSVSPTLGQFIYLCLLVSVSRSHFLPSSLPPIPPSLPPFIPASLPPMFTLQWIRDKVAMLLSVQFHQLEIGCY